MPDPIPLRDIDAEQALLGSIMIAPYLFVDLVTFISDELARAGIQIFPTVFGVPLIFWGMWT